jgi:streptogramin lyase
VTQSFHEVATPATNSNPYGITVDASNDVWFTENTDAVALIGEYAANGTLNEYKEAYSKLNLKKYSPTAAR